jgi:hypothetical protein
MRWILIFLPLALLGCAGSHGASTPNNTNYTPGAGMAEGLWVGPITTQKTGTTQGVVIAIASGETRIIGGNNEMFVGSMSHWANGNLIEGSFIGSVSLYPASGTSNASETLNFAAAFGATAGYFGAFTPLDGSLSGSDVGEFNLYNSQPYYYSTSQTDLIGTYKADATGTSTASSATLTIDAQGNLSGTLGSLAINGNAAPVTTGKNAFRIAWTRVVNGQTVQETGLGCILYTAPPPNSYDWGAPYAFVVQVSGPSTQFAATFSKQ